MPVHDNLFGSISTSAQFINIYYVNLFAFDFEKDKLPIKNKYI